MKSANSRNSKTLLNEGFAVLENESTPPPVVVAEHLPSAYDRAVERMKECALPTARVQIADRWRLQGEGLEAEEATLLLASEIVLEEGGGHLLNATIHEANDALAEAEKARQAALQKRREGLAIQYKWERLVESFKQLHERLVQANGICDRTPLEEDRWHQKFLEAFGTTQVPEHIDAVLRRRARRELLEEGRAHVQKLYNEHVEAMRAFVEANGLPADLLTDLKDS